MLLVCCRHVTCMSPVFCGGEGGGDRETGEYSNVLSRAVHLSYTRRQLGTGAVVGLGLMWWEIKDAV